MLHRDGAAGLVPYSLLGGGRPSRLRRRRIQLIGIGIGTGIEQCLSSGRLDSADRNSGGDRDAS